MVRTTDPVEASSSVTLLPPLSVAQTLVPSDEMPKASLVGIV
jgi:hypothetical protein